ncbi:MAG: polysaccharide biosynthesis tyrosine autokinase [Chitinophagaceae bacterium]|nr:polysaccharide biosynthesis tyrosine autokinase [Chitinophagaceae bacterium]
MQQRVNKTIQKEENQLSQMMAGYISYWPLFLICLALSIAGAYVYIRYAIPKYEAVATILIKDEKRGVDVSKTEQAIDPLGTTKIIENEVEVLQSQVLLDSVAVKLHLYAPISQEGKLRIQSAYTNSPVIVEAKYPNKLKKYEKIPFRYDSGTSKIILNNKFSGPLNEWLKTPYGELMFLYNPRFNGNTGSKPFFLDLHKAKSIGGSLLSGLKIESNKLSSVLDLTYKDEVPERAEDILNTLIDYYNKSAISEKNNLVKNTLASIESRLVVVSKNLDSIQKKVKEFKANNQAVDLGSQSQNFMSRIGASDAEMREASTQLAALNDLKKAVSSGENVGILPTPAGISDPGLTQQMTSLNNAQLELERLKRTVGEGNPLLGGIRDQINKMKPNVLNNIETQIKNMKLVQNSYSSASGQYNSLLTGIPEKERQLLEISRDQNIQNGIYQFLLQKREESELSYASANSDSKVINYAKSSGSAVSPKTNMIYFAAMLLGLMLPIIFVNGRELLNNKILYRKEIESLTTIPVIGEIVHNKSRSSLVLEPGKRSFIAEEFRKVRVSLLFLGIDSYHKKVLVTSSIPGEGKSFIAANLAVSLAMTGKKVVLVDADLHNPSLGKLFGVTTEEIGVSEYLLGERTAEEIIRKIPNHENLSFVSSGGLHPTPSELLENGQVQNLIAYLESKFDLVVMDTAPVVMVTDAYHLSSLADATLYVVRHKYTPKMLVKRIDENNKINSLKNPAIIFNGVKTRGFMKNNYGYGYDYVYGGNQKISKGKKLKA